MPRPFERVPFRELPDRPRVPHDDARASLRDLSMRSEPFGEIRVRYRELGDGPPLLLVHGLMTSSYSWRYVIAPLARRYRVIAPDLPGAGGSDKRASCNHSAAALAEWIVELQATLGIRGCLAVGNSLGGYLCMRAALRDGGAFSRLVNIHSPALPDARYHVLHAALALPGARRLLVRMIHRDPERWVWRNVHYFDETLKSREETREYAAALSTDEGAGAFVRYLADAMAPAGFRDFVAELDARRGPFPMPLLLLYSRRDPLVPPRNGDALHAKIPGSSLVWLDDTSHFAHVDTPEPVLRAVEAFFGA
jgi:pimeloyl-ACP methyl ester carboxylesterase